MSTESHSPASVTAGDTMRRGLAVLGVGIRREPKIFSVAVAGSLLFGALTVADAWVLGWSTEHVVIPAFETGEVGWSGLIAIIALFVGVAILRAVGIVARRLGGGIMYFRMQAHHRRDVTRQYLRLPMSWHQRHPTGQLLSNANSDVEAAWAPLMPLPMALGTIAMMVIAVLQMMLTNLVLALVGLLVFPLVILANVFYQRVQSPLMTRAQALRAEVSEVAHESFDGALVVKTLGREGEETQRFRHKADLLRDTNVKAGKVRAVFDPVLEALPNLGVLAVLGVGVALVLNGQSDAADVVTVAYLLTIVAFPIRSLGWLVGEFPRSVVGYDRVSRVLAATGQMEYGGGALTSYDGGGARLEVDSVCYRYEDGAELLRDLSFGIEPGRTVAVVGATAAGKSTLTSLLVRLVDPLDGEVRVDGTDLRDLGPGELARHVALVPQHAFLFDDTVRDNVTLGADVPDETVWDALRTAQADGFVAALPAGLDTRLGERGTTLSGGQRQRLSLARALVRSPRLLIMDDATSAVDPEVEARILAALRGAGASGATILVVAYRKATIALADEVVYLRDGRVADQGSHGELLARNPGYAHLVNAYEAEHADEPHDEAVRP